MNRQRRLQAGFTLIEMLVVLAIIAALSIAAVTTINGRPNAAVRTTLDQIEGTILGAQKLAVASGQDVYLVADGEWSASGGNPFVLAYDTIKPVDRTSNPTNPDVAARLRIVAQARNPVGDTTDPAGVFTLTYDASTKVLSRDQMYAGVVVGNSSWYTIALDNTPDLRTIAPGNAPPFSTALSPANQLCLGTPNFVTVSGANKRFTRDFFINVVGIRGTSAMPGSPVGFLVVPANSGTVYKFINSGKLVGPAWRRM